MNTNKINIWICIIVIFIVVSFATSYKIIKKHNKVLIRVTEEKIINAAKKCVLESKCTDKEITLKTLYDYNYLEEINNPITKEYYNDESYVLIENDNYKFIVK